MLHSCPPLQVILLIVNLRVRRICDKFLSCTYFAIMCTGAPCSKKRKIEKKSRAEKNIDRAIDAFIAYQSEAEERFQKQEEERWKKEMELEEKRRKEDREHELRMLQMMGQIFHRDYSSNPFEYSDNYYDQ